jgi:hypothetical protein
VSQVDQTRDLIQDKRLANHREAADDEGYAHDPTQTGRDFAQNMTTPIAGAMPLIRAFSSARLAGARVLRNVRAFPISA